MKTAEPNISARNKLIPRKLGHGKKWVSFAGITFSLLFSFWLMFHTFSYDDTRQEMRIASKAWSDFGAHIPLIRSFSYGPNLNRLLSGAPVQSPLFPGEPIRYHFGFYGLVGLLERVGVPLDLALNIPSALGLFFLLVLIYLLSYGMFANIFVSFLSVLFFLFNGSLSFLSYFRKHPIHLGSLRDMVNNETFTSFGPWDGGVITAFWSLNIFTNQRHLAISYALVCFILYVLLCHKHSKNLGVSIGACMSLLLMFNYPSAVMASLFCLWFFIVKRSVRTGLILAFVISLPIFFFMRHVSSLSSAIVWQPGYLIRDTLTWGSFVHFWGQNIGLHTLLIPAGLLLAPKTIRRAIGPPLVLLFLLPNLYRFSTDMINNHKFFNFALIMGNIFSAYGLYRIVNQFSRIRQKFIGNLIKIIVATGIILPLTASGILDIFPVINDRVGSVPDIKGSIEAQFFERETMPTDIIANSTWFYHPASIAGRSLLSGYTYFTWSYGYDQSTREESLLAIFRARDTRELCLYTRQSNVAYIELAANPEEYLKPNLKLYQSLPFVYKNPDTQRTIYNVSHICKQ